MSMLQELVTPNGFYIKHYIRPYILCKLTMILIIITLLFEFVVTFTLEAFTVKFTRQLLVLQW